MKNILCIALAMSLALVAAGAAAEERVIRLYDGPAPGSEAWRQVEKESRFGAGPDRYVTNVVDPTLTVFEPEASKATGAAAVIYPGGGFQILSIDHEGYDLARWLAERGVTSFVLKYRLVETKTESPFAEMAKNLADFDNAVAPVLKLAVADGLAAMGYVRRHAGEFGLKPERIGMIGISAGGLLSAKATCAASEETRPSFVGLIYSGWRDSDAQVPADAPPIFLMAAADDQIAPDSLKLYQLWRAANRSAELHIYSAGGHGFGMRKQNKPSDQWPEQFARWLADQGMLKK